jgi:hypothetical protein
MPLLEHVHYFPLGVIIIVAVLAVGVFAVKLRVSGSPAPHDLQATPRATLNTLFEMMAHGFEDTLIGFSLLKGKDLSPEQQKFAGLFCDYERAAVIYNALYDRDAKLQSIGDQNQKGDTATVGIFVGAFPSAEADEKRDLVYSFEMKKRGANWCVYELRGEKSSVGLYERYQQLKSGNP